MFDLARLVAVTLLAVLAQSPQGSQPPSASQQPPRVRGGTNLVRVDAFATKEGVPVQNLTADDFEIFEDGTRQKIDMEATPDSPPWSGALLDRSGTKTGVPVTVGSRTDTGSGQRWLTADVTLAPLGAGDYVIELKSAAGTEQRRTLVAIRVTQ